MIRFSPIRNLDKVQAFLKTVPRGTMKTAIVSIAKYLIGNKRHGLAHDDPYKYVSRKSAYGQTFQSDKQRRYVMAKIRSGEITPGQRKKSPTDQAGGYNYVLTNSGYGATITNTEDGAYWTRKAQPAQLRMVGWRSYSKVVTDNIKGAIRQATADVNKWLKANGK